MFDSFCFSLQLVLSLGAVVLYPLFEVVDCSTALVLLWICFVAILHPEDSWISAYAVGRVS